MGVRGGVKVIDKVPKPAFNLHVNGGELQGKERFGEDWGAMLEENIPAFMAEVGETVAQAGQTFAEWFPEHRETLKEIAGKYMAQ